MPHKLVGVRARRALWRRAARRARVHGDRAPVERVGAAAALGLGRRLRRERLEVLLRLERTEQLRQKSQVEAFGISDQHP